MGSRRLRPAELVLGIGGSLAVLAALLLRPPGWETAAVVLATLLPTALVLYGGVAARRARDAQATASLVAGQRESLAREADDLARSRAELQQRVSELVALNELGIALSSTLDLDELLDRALHAVVAHLPFDRALVLLVDEAGGELSGGRSIGGSESAAALVPDLRVPLAEHRSTLAQLAAADGPMVFRAVDEDAYEPNRALARALEVTSFLGTPLDPPPGYLAPSRPPCIPGLGGGGTGPTGRSSVWFMHRGHLNGARGPWGARSGRS